MRWSYVIMDYITSFIAFFAFNQVRYVLMNMTATGLTFSQFLCEPKLILEQAVIPPFMLFTYWASGYYNHPFGKSRLQELSQTLFAALVNSLIIFMVLLINDKMQQRSVNYEIFLFLFTTLFFFVYIGRLFLTTRSIRNIEKRKWGFNTVIIGASDDAIMTADRLDKTQTKLGYNIIGHIPIESEKVSSRDFNQLSKEDFIESWKNKEIDQLVIVPTKDMSEDLILNTLYEYFPTRIPIKIQPSSLTFLTSGIRIRDIYAEPFIDLASPTMSDAQLNIKRLADIMISTLALILSSPLILGIALAVKLTSKGPLIYRQERIGFRHKPFKILKFRTMKNDAEADGPHLSVDDDPRITTVGRFLRKYRLDEIPQFWNVIRGEMSLVGPRPEREYYIEQIVKKAPHYTLVHQVKPGITSWGMVKFGYASTVDEMVERSKYDLIYLGNMTLGVDCKILLHTISTVLLGKGK